MICKLFKFSCCYDFFCSIYLVVVGFFVGVFVFSVFIFKFFLKFERERIIIVVDRSCQIGYMFKVGMVIDFYWKEYMRFYSFRNSLGKENGDYWTILRGRIG